MIELTHGPDNPAGFVPAARKALNSRFAEELHHLEHGMRLPGGVYSISVSRVLSRFEALMEAVRRIVSESADAKVEDAKLAALAEHINGLLYSLLEHVEDCTKVLLCFFSTKKSYSRDSRVRKYKKQIERYQGYISRRVNHLKHNHGRVRPVVVSQEGAITLGYFIEGVLPDGAVGPHPDIHRRLDAYSLSRDLRFHLFHLYATSEALRDTIAELATPFEQLPDNSEELSQRFARLTCAVAGLNTVVFPGEPALEWPLIICAVDGNEIRAEMSLGPITKQTTTREILPGARISASFEGDGTPNQKYRLPLWNKKR